MIGLNDATLFGWITTTAYALAAWLALGASRAVPPERHPRHETAARFWKATALLMLLLAFNKQADLQTELTDLLRQVARTGGWYRERRVYQLLFIEGMAVLGLMLTLWLLNKLRRQPASVKAGAIGVILTMAFIVVRAASFHHHDVLGSKAFLGLRLHQLFELSCIALVGLSAHAARPGRDAPQEISSSGKPKTEN